MSLWQKDNLRFPRDGSLAAIIAFCYCKKPEWISDALDYAEENRRTKSEAEESSK